MRGNNISDKQHNNFNFNDVLAPQETDDMKILNLAKTRSEKICRVFGLDKDYGFF